MVININSAPQGWQEDSEYVYIGRAGKRFAGYFGNPIDANSRWDCLVCGERHTNGGDTLVCYETWLREKIENDFVYKNKVKELNGKILVCFCAPKPCHGNVLEKVSKELNDKEI